MPGERRKRSSQAGEWVPKQKSGRSRTTKGAAKKPAAADANAWLPSKAKRNGAKRNGAKADGTVAKPPTRNRRKPESRLARVSLIGNSQREQRLQSKLRRANQKIASQQEEITRLEKQLKQPAKATRTKTTRSKSSRSTAGRPDLNELTFEQLREFGLSVTQSARLTAAREGRGGFDSLDQLDEVPGLSKETVGNLKDQLRVD